MSNKIKKMQNFPIIYYEETAEGMPESNMPYIEIGKDDPSPPALVINEYRHTGEVEPDENGNPQPIVDIDILMFINLDLLKNNLDSETFDLVRKAIGLEPLGVAQKKGEKILENITKNK